MSTPVSERRPPSLGRRLGLPDTGGRGNYVASTVIDSLAHGLVFAFLLVYFDRVTDVGLGTIGLALSAGRLAALPVPALIGPLMDRFGSKTIVVAGNVASSAGMVVCAVAADAWHIALAQLLVQTGTNAYWTCSRDLVGIASRGEQRSRWFGLQNALRNIGAGFGAAATAGALAVLGDGGLRGVIVVSAVSFLVAGALLLAWRTGDGSAPEAESEDGEEAAPEAVSYLDVFRDRRYMALLGVNFSFVLAAMVLPLLIAIWTIDHVGVGAWWAGALVVLNTAIVALLSTVIVSRTEHRRPHRLVQFASALNAASFALFALALGLPEAAAVAALVVAMLVYTLGEVVGTPYINELTVTLAPATGAGRYHAAFQLSWSLGMATAPALFAALITYGALLPWLFLGAVSVLVIPLARRFAAP
ncbi:MFS transporter [Glycomyces sp. NRRL B-16210]|uniref:MFS transporter n=1 Tax=Glycomyces sp. NRRL B-16210 TaxID=1463821 RepID=UPI00068FFD92|nr:MFS transporter [Glycomyces sp. NRRL B-16210]